MDYDGVFNEANKLLQANKYSEAIQLYGELQAAGNHAAVNHNKGLALALDDQPDEAMHELTANMRAYDKYAKSWTLAAEIHRRAAKGELADRSIMLVEASKFIRTALEIDRFDPQTCIVASQVMAACTDCQTEAITWHVNALAAIRARSSKLSPNFATVYMDNCADEALHYFDMPPEEAVTTGSLPTEAREVGKCLAVIAEAVPPHTPPSWPVLLVTYGVGPRKTEPGHIHVRTQYRWAALFQAARSLLDIDIPTAMVWDRPNVAWDPTFDTSQALIITRPSLSGPLHETGQHGGAQHPEPTVPPAERPTVFAIR